MVVCWSVSRLIEQSLDTSLLYAQFVQVGTAVVAGLATYVVCGVLLRSDELRHALDMVPFGRKK
jgi:hypothetical protein